MVVHPPLGRAQNIGDIVHRRLVEPLEHKALRRRLDDLAAAVMLGRGPLGGVRQRVVIDVFVHSVQPLTAGAQ